MNLMCLGFHYSDFSFVESSLLPNSSLVFSGIVIGSMESKVFLLEAETFAIKSAILAASTLEFRHLNVFTNLLSLVKLLKSRSDVNEREIILHDFVFLLGHVSSISIFYVFFTAYILAKSLSVSTLLDLNISSVVRV